MHPKRPSPVADHLDTPSQPSKQARLSPGPTPVNSRTPLRSLPFDSPVWAGRHTTCLSLGLNPNEPSHAAVICNNCSHYWEAKLKRNVGLHPQPPRSGRMTCERPFDCGDKVKGYKVRLKTQLKQLFSGTCAAAAPAGRCITPRRRTSRGRPYSASTVKLNQLKNKTKEPNQKRGSVKLFNENGSLTAGLTDRLKASLVGRENLKANEIDLIHCLLDSHLASYIKSSKTLTETDKRLFGKFVAVAFSKIPEGQSLSLPNFRRSKNI